MQHIYPFYGGDVPEEENLYDLFIGNGESSCFAALLIITTAGDGENFVVENGLVSYVIGKGTVAEGVFADIYWSGGPYFL